jgi:hypothetical protein
MAHEYKKAADESHARRLKAYGADEKALGSKAKATNWAGFDALNTDQQAGRKPLNSGKYIPPEVTPERTAKKKGGAVSGAQSLKRLDKSSRKSKSLTASAARPPMKGTGQREGQIPSGTTEQESWDPQTKFKPGAMDESSPRKKGGRVAKAYGGGFEALLEDIGSALFGGEEEAAAPARARSARPAARQAMGKPHNVVRRHIIEEERPAAPRPPRRPADLGEAPLPPRRPADLGMERPSAMSAPRDTTFGRPDEAGMGSFMDQYLYDRNAAPAQAPAPLAPQLGAPDETSSRNFLSSMGVPQGRKKGGRVQDYTDRSHDAVGKQYRKVSKANGGMADYEEHDEDDHEDHEDEAMDRALVKKMVKEDALTGKSHGGRTKRASGGKAGKSTVNIMIGGPQPQGGPGMDPMLMAALAGAAGGPGAMPPPPPPPGQQGGMQPPPPPPQVMMASPPPQMPPQGGPGGMPMPRKDGGKVQVPYRKPGRKDEYPDMDFGSGGGFGRKQKIDAYGAKQKR